MSTLCMSSFSVTNWSESIDSVIGSSMSGKFAVTVVGTNFTGYNECVNFDMDSVRASLESETIGVPMANSVEELDAWLMGLDL